VTADGAYDTRKCHDAIAERGAKILKMREEIKKQTMRNRRLQHQAAAA
jgi:hypothetical protein